MIFVKRLYISPRTIVRNVTPCKFADGYQRCWVRCYRHHQGRTTWKRERRIVHHRDGQNIFVRNAGVYMRNFTALVLSSFCFCIFLLSSCLHFFIFPIFSFLKSSSRSVSVYFFYLSFFVSSCYSRFFPVNFFSLCFHILFYLCSLIVLCSSYFSFFHSFSLLYFVYINPCEEETVIRIRHCL
jgi:hypothetical protein